MIYDVSEQLETFKHYDFSVKLSNPPDIYIM